MILKCKMCGGDLHPADGATTCSCEFCGTLQTIPKLDNDRRANLYDRANLFRRANEYDKAMGMLFMLHGGKHCHVDALRRGFRQNRRHA